MFDFIRNLAKPAGEKQQERLQAYVDGELTAAELQVFEQQIAADPALQAEVESLRQVKAEMRALPPVRAPRNFTLDPALYGKPEPDRPGQLLPVLRVATALTAILFVSVLVLDLINPSGLDNGAGAPLTETTFQDSTVAEVAVEEQPVEVTRVVIEAAEAEIPAEAEMAESAVEEEMVEEELAAEEAMEAPAPLATQSVAAVEASDDAETTDDATANATAGIAADEAYPSPEIAGEASLNDYPEPPPTGDVIEDSDLALISPTTPPIADEVLREADAAETTAATVAPVVEPEIGVKREPVSALRLAQIALGIALLLLLAVLLIYHRR